MMQAMAHNPTRGCEILKQEFSTLLGDEPMARHTSFKVGGAADLFATPTSRDELIRIVTRARALGVPVSPMGSGTNILVRDKGIRGLVLSMKKINARPTITRISGTESLVTVSSGVILAALARFAMDHGLAGFGFAAGIPGTVGGAVMMNAGTALGTISDSLVSLEILTLDGEVKTVERSDLGFSHREISFNGFGPEVLVLGADFLLAPGDRSAMQASWAAHLEKRRASQPGSAASAGCFFKNPDKERPAGLLIDKAGLKGRRCGNAMVSEAHANFIVNLGGATASDILALKRLVENEVKNQFNVDLKPEVKIDGE
ncbi:MAG: UDP-N-acetylmuramate dehydrogenase [Desulfobacteraceae bacterium]|nr:UDP-N-acetylmuramate dehydrogenase [Desulfobacteraceae bacterium]